MLLGTTYAWFTDSAVSGSNIITAGNLDANMYFSDTLLDAESSDWKNAEGESIFTYDKWEPGYTEVKYLKIENAGNLSFKWRLYIKADVEVTKLADGFDETKLSQATLYVFVSALNDNDETYETQSFSLQLNNGDWENTEISLEGFTGPVKVVITDYFYCLRTTAILVNEGAEAKFDVLREGHGVGQKEARAADFFQLKDGAELVGDVTVTVTYNGETVKFSDSAENWKDITFAMDELGQWVVTITDDDGFCAVSVVNVTVYDDMDSDGNESGEDFV